MLDDFLALIAPHHCYLCQKTGLILCDCCKKHLLAQCSRLSFNYHQLQATGQVYSLADSQSILKELIYDYKLHCRRVYGRLLAELIVDCLRIDQNLPTELIIVPAPTSRTSKLQRGFGHTELIAKNIQRYGYQVCYDLINQATVAQKDLRLRERRNNARRNLRTKTMMWPKGQYLIIDDITTSGATLQYSRQALLQAGAGQVACLALVHA